MAGDKMYCISCHILVRQVMPSKQFIGKNKPEEPWWIHTTTRDNSGSSYCGVRLLAEEEIEPLTEADETQVPL